MFKFPGCYNAENHLVEADIRIINGCLDECKFLEAPCDEDVYELCQIMLSERNIQETWIKLLTLIHFTFLKTELEFLLQDE